MNTSEYFGIALSKWGVRDANLGQSSDGEQDKLNGLEHLSYTTSCRNVFPGLKVQIKAKLLEPGARAGRLDHRDAELAVQVPKFSHCEQWYPSLPLEQDPEGWIKEHLDSTSHDAGSMQATRRWRKSSSVGLGSGCGGAILSCCFCIQGALQAPLRSVISSCHPDLAPGKIGTLSKKCCFPGEEIEG